MTKLDLEIHDDALKVLNKIKSINDSGIELVIPEGSVLFDNILNLKLIEKQAEAMGVSVQFTTNDEAGNSLISGMEGGVESAYPDEQFSGQPSTQGLQEEKKKLRISVPKISFKFPKLNFSGKSVYLFVLIFLIILVVMYSLAGRSLPKAEAKIVLSSTPLTRSVSVKVQKGTETNIQNSILKGSPVETTIETSGEIETTGEKLIGEKAKGKVILYNKSTEEITLKKGAELLYDDDNEGYKFSLDSEVTIPSSHQEGSDPSSPIIPGEKETEVTAQDIGSGYNISKDKSLEVSKYKKSVLEAKAKSSFEGGKADKVKVVAEIDRTNLSKTLQEQGLSGIEISLKSKLVSPNKLISGAVGSVVTKEAFSHKTGDQADKITLTQTLSVTGLTYSETELNDMLNKLSDSMAPQNFSLSKKDWSVKVEVLGNSTNSVLSTTEADLQVTLKTSIIPIVDKEQIKKSMAGKPYTEATKILGSITNVSNYELRINPALPFFRKVPKDLTKIEVTVENE